MSFNRLFPSFVLGAFLTLSSVAFAAEAPKDMPAAHDAGGSTHSAGHETATPERKVWSFAGPFGVFDRAQLQRGFQIYKEVCSSCHALNIPFRTLSQPGGPEFTTAQIKALAATYKVKDGPNEKGEMFERPGRPSDIIPGPFANEQAAAAALGKAPPDMSLLAKARKYERGFPLFLLDPFMQYQELGPDYIYAILTGYTKADDANWNAYFPGHQIAMAKPLSDGQVNYTDGSPQTLDQYARDMSAFLMWAAEPQLEARKKMGFRVMIFLLAFAALLYFVKKRVWSNAH